MYKQYYVYVTINALLSQNCSNSFTTSYSQNYSGIIDAPLNTVYLEIFDDSVAMHTNFSTFCK